jgi:hypothetical protein
METSPPVPHIELVMRRTGAAPGQLAVAAIETLLEEHPGAFTWTTIDALSRSALKRLQELQSEAQCEIPVPAVLLDGKMVFDHMPKAEDLTALITQRAGL